MAILRNGINKYNLSFYKIDSEEIVTIPVNQQMVSHGALELEGIIILEGRLIII